MWNTVVVDLDVEKGTTNFASTSDQPGITAKSVDTIDIAKVIEYDTSVFGTSRGEFLQTSVVLLWLC